MNDDISCMYKYTNIKPLKRYVSTWVPYIVVYPPTPSPKPGFPPACKPVIIKIRLYDQRLKHNRKGEK